MSAPPNLVVAITGASGSIYGVRLVEALLRAGATVDVTLSAAAAKVIAVELGKSVDAARPRAAELFDAPTENVRMHRSDNLLAPIASGSHRHGGMAIVPCSMGTIGRLAAGVSGNLIERAADVCLKERRKLVLVPRETPLSEIHCRNLLGLTRAGATILPASPGFYHRPESIEDLAAFIVSRILDQFGFDAGLMRRWGEPR